MDFSAGERLDAAVLILTEQHRRALERDVGKLDATVGGLCAEYGIHRQIKRHIDKSAGDVSHVRGDILFNSLSYVVFSENLAERGAVRARHELDGQDVRFLILISHDVSSLVERPSPGVGEHDEKRTAGRRPKLLRKHAQKLEH
mgnify:FL=1